MITQETTDIILQFRDDRNWRQFHNPNDLAISMNLEAAELLEVFQWSGTELFCKEKLPLSAEELADVASYCVRLADACGLDLDQILRDKFRKNSEKYPVDKAYGSSKMYTEL